MPEVIGGRGENQARRMLLWVDVLFSSIPAFALGEEPYPQKATLKPGRTTLLWGSASAEPDEGCRQAVAREFV